MDAMTALHTRNSAAKLIEPAPSAADRELIFQAALTAPDHARLRPWRFLTVEGEARKALGEKMAAASLKDKPELEDAIYNKLLNAPLRAPLILIAVAKIQIHPKVPEIEQLLSAGSAVSQMLVAAHALGYAGIWRTGSVSFSRTFMDSIGLAANEKIVGIIYLGSINGTAKPLAKLSNSEFFAGWDGS